MANTKIGVLQDFLMPEASQQVMLDAMTLAFDEALEDRLIDRPVEIVLKAVDGLPRGTTHEVLVAYRELVDEGVVAIFGPWASENALALRSYIEDEAKVPTLSMASSAEWLGEWCFAIPNGSLTEEPYLIANYLAAQGAEKIALLVERSLVGEQYRTFFRAACDFEGLSIAGELGIHMLESDLTPLVEQLRATGADAVAVFGFGMAAVHLNDAFAEVGWNPRVRVMNSGFMTAPFLPGGVRALSGWVGVDQYDAENEVAQDFLDRFEKRFGYRPANFFSTLCYDFAALLVEGISKATPLAPNGVKQGLEKIRMLPAATGGPGSVFCLAPYRRQAWMTPDFIVLRTPSADVEPGLDLTRECGTELVHRYQPRGRTARLARRD